MSGETTRREWDGNVGRCGRGGFLCAEAAKPMHVLFMFMEGMGLLRAIVVPQGWINHYQVRDGLATGSCQSRDSCLVGPNKALPFPFPQASSHRPHPPHQHPTPPSIYNRPLSHQCPTPLAHPNSPTPLQVLLPHPPPSSIPHSHWSAPSTLSRFGALPLAYRQHHPLRISLPYKNDVHAECNKKKPLGLSRFGDELNLTPKLGYFIFWKIRPWAGISFYGHICS